MSSGPVPHTPYKFSVAGELISDQTRPSYLITSPPSPTMMTSSGPRNKWLSAQSMALAVLIGAGASMSAHADQAVSADREIHLHPRFTKRCRALDVATVPDVWTEFEARIIKWMGTCVTSRSGNARREVTLVRASTSLVSLWRSLISGKSARIVPRYTWGEFRVERVEFSSP